MTSRAINRHVQADGDHLAPAEVSSLDQMSFTFTPALTARQAVLRGEKIP